MKKIFFIIISAVFFSCGEVDTKNNLSGDSTDVNLPTSKLEALTELSEVDPESHLLFSGFGSEPGWTLEIYSNKLRVLLDYGKDSLIVEEDFASTYTAENFNYNLPDKKFTLNVEKKICTDDSKGDTHTHFVSLDFKEKKYTGCGDLKD